MRNFFLFAFFAMAMTLTPLVTEAQYFQDPGDLCLCPDDPFCNCNSGGTGGTGGGGTPGGSCKECGTTWDMDSEGNLLHSEACYSATAQGNYMDDCYIQPDGSCELFGWACAIYLV